MVRRGDMMVRKKQCRMNGTKKSRSKQRCRESNNQEKVKYGTVRNQIQAKRHQNTSEDEDADADQTFKRMQSVRVGRIANEKRWGLGIGGI